MKSVVMTGGGGFIGSHLATYLTGLGYDVFAVITPGSHSRERLAGLDRVHIVEGELSEYKTLIPALPEYPLAFFHFAWTGVRPECRNDFSVQMQNVELSVNAVKLASAIKAQKFVFPGSTMEYVYYGKPLDQNAVPSPLNAYGVAKISARYACSVLCREMDLAFVYVVISSIYSEDRNDNNVIYYTISRLLRREKPSLTRLEQLWDYIHIDDVTRGLLLIAEKGRDQAFYALGHGDNWPLSNYIIVIRDLIDPSLPLGVGEVPYVGSRLPCSCVNLTPLYEDTGFVPEISFEDGIARVINIMKQRE